MVNLDIDILYTNILYEKIGSQKKSLIACIKQQNRTEAKKKLIVNCKHAPLEMGNVYNIKKTTTIILLYTFTMESNLWITIIFIYSYHTILFVGRFFLFHIQIYY